MVWDLDPQAVELTMMSLYIKLLERGERAVKSEVNNAFFVI